MFSGFRFDPKDPRYVVPVHALKVSLRDNLQSLIPVLQEGLDIAFQAAFPLEECSNGGYYLPVENSAYFLLTRAAWLKFSPHSTCHKMVDTLNNIVLVGQELGKVSDVKEAS